MTALQRAIGRVRQGQLVDCSREEYHQGGVRTGLQDQAGRWIDDGQDPYAIVALNEVKRLDLKFDIEAISGQKRAA